MKLNYEFPCHFSPGCNFCQNSNMPCLPDGTRMTPVVSQNSVLSPTRSHQLNAGLHNLWQPGSRAAKKWRDKEKMKRKWKENEELERDSLSIFPHFLFISSLAIHFLYQTLPKALRTQALTALTSNFGEVGLVR